MRPKTSWASSGARRLAVSRDVIGSLLSAIGFTERWLIAIDNDGRFHPMPLRRKDGCVSRLRSHLDASELVASALPAPGGQRLDSEAARFPAGGGPARPGRSGCRPLYAGPRLLFQGRRPDQDCQGRARHRGDANRPSGERRGARQLRPVSVQPRDRAALLRSDRRCESRVPLRRGPGRDPAVCS